MSLFSESVVEVKSATGVLTGRVRQGEVLGANLPNFALCSLFYMTFKNQRKQAPVLIEYRALVGCFYTIASNHKAIKGVLL